MLKIVGSIDIIGNPLNLINQVASGVVDMIE